MKNFFDKEFCDGFIRGLKLGTVAGSIIGSFVLGITLGAKAGAYFHTKLDERGLLVPRVSQQCKTQGGFK